MDPTVEMIIKPRNLELIRNFKWYMNNVEDWKLQNESLQENKREEVYYWLTIWLEVIWNKICHFLRDAKQSGTSIIKLLNKYKRKMTQQNLDVLFASLQYVYHSENYDEICKLLENGLSLFAYIQYVLNDYRNCDISEDCPPECVDLVWDMMFFSYRLAEIDVNVPLPLLDNLNSYFKFKLGNKDYTFPPPKGNVFYQYYNGGKTFKTVIDGHNAKVYRVKYDFDTQKNYLDPKTPLLDVNFEDIMISQAPRNFATAWSGGYGPRFDGWGILMHIKDLEYICISQYVYAFTALAPITEFYTPVGNDGMSASYAIDAEGNYYELEEYHYVKHDDPALRQLSKGDAVSFSFYTGIPEMKYYSLAKREVIPLQHGF